MTPAAAAPPAARPASPVSEWERAAAVRLALRHARTADGLLVGEPGRERLFAAEGRAVAGAIPFGGSTLLPGGPLAAPEDRPALLRAVEQFGAARGLAPLWLNVTAPELPALRAAGYAPTRTAAECVVRHPGEWSGTRYRAVRAACGRAERGGVRLSELSAARPDGWVDLPGLFAAHLAAKPQRRPATPFVARPPNPAATPRRVWLASANDQAVGFATAQPLGVYDANGSRRWTLGAFHTRPDAPLRDRGAAGPRGSG